MTAEYEADYLAGPTRLPLSHFLVADQLSLHILTEIRRVHCAGRAAKRREGQLCRSMACELYSSRLA